MDDDELRDGDLREGDAHEQIVRLEDRMEQLAATIESCRKFMLLSRAAIIVGGILFVATMVGAIGFYPSAMVAGAAGVIGGIVLLGSNRSTLQEATAALHATEAQRAALIGQIELRVVSGGNGHWARGDALRPPTIH